jgi:GNAT superfamily N-acetyltransferase
VQDSEIEVASAIGRDRLPQLMQLYASAWWAADRQPERVWAMLADTDLVIALVHRPTGRLLGVARVLTDFVYQALLVDVIVDEAERGSGLGARLLDAVVDHPRLRDVRSLELVCRPELVPFYRRWGFTDEVGGSLVMRRVNAG